jgi:hypothetical protein
MEVHLSWTSASALPLLVANGVTDVRDMNSNLDQIEDWRTRISTGLLVGPYILRVGPMLNGKSFNSLLLRDKSNLRAYQGEDEAAFPATVNPFDDRRGRQMIWSAT